jgi:predicted phosphodiesterase
MTPGRSCPLSYRYGPHALATAPVRQAQTLYVVGGLYGNVPALDALDALLAQETGPVTVCFNGDFNWFNVDANMLREVNTRVLQHDAIAGNVEAELCTALDDAGCGCAYPESVDAQVVERSNRIHARLKAALHQHPDLRARLSSLPMFARYDVAGLRVAVVHGDAESLAGWGFDHAALTDDTNDAWLSRMFAQAQVDVFASSHTCVPVLKDLGGVVINNGAAGMPNFSGRQQGLITRIGAQPLPHALYGVHKKGLHIQAVPLAYDALRWEQDFLKQWPPGSDAHTSYFARIQGRLSFHPEQALA